MCNMLWTRAATTTYLLQYILVISTQGHKNIRQYQTFPVFYQLETII